MSRRRIMDDPIIISTQTNAPVMRVLWDKGVADREHSFSHGEAVKRFTGGQLSNSPKVPWADWFKENIEIEHFDEFKYFTGIKDLTDGLSGHLFYHCTNLKSIKLPENLQRIGTWYSYYNGPFTGTQIEYIKIPDSVYNIGASLLSDMPKLKKVTWSKNLPVGLPMSNYAIDTFSDCPNLTEIENFPTEYTPGNISSMFDNCYKLDIFDETKYPIVYQFDTSSPFSDNLYLKGTYTFPAMKRVSQEMYRYNRKYKVDEEFGSEHGFFVFFPNVETISMNYWRTPGLITIGENCTTLLNNNSFNLNVQNYGNIRFLGSTPPTAPQEQSSVSGVSRIYVPENAVDTYKNAYGWSTAASKIRAWKDASNATFCSFSNDTTIPSDYTIIEYVTNDGKDVNLNINYTPKIYTQMLADIQYTPTGIGQAFQLYTNGPEFDGAAYVAPKIRWSINGLTQGFWFNSRLTGEKIDVRSILKTNYSFLQWHGFNWLKDQATTDNTTSCTLFRYTGGICKCYRLSFFEPIENCTDYDDESQYVCVRDYIPCKRNSDDAIGLYERINSTFYTKNTIYGPTE